MNIPSRPELLARLVSDLGYPTSGAELLADQIEHLQPQLVEIFSRWWEGGALPAIEVGGYTASRLVEEFGFTPLAALLTLDWLIREPEVAKTAIKSGYDYVVTGK